MVAGTVSEGGEGAARRRGRREEGRGEAPHRHLCSGPMARGGQNGNLWLKQRHQVGGEREKNVNFPTGKAREKIERGAREQQQNHLSPGSGQMDNKNNILPLLLALASG